MWCFHALCMYFILWLKFISTQQSLDVFSPRQIHNRFSVFVNIININSVTKNRHRWQKPIADLPVVNRDTKTNTNTRHQQWTAFLDVTVISNVCQMEIANIDGNRFLVKKRSRERTLVKIYRWRRRWWWWFFQLSQQLLCS